MRRAVNFMTMWGIVFLSLIMVGCQDRNEEESEMAIGEFRELTPEEKLIKRGIYGGSLMWFENNLGWSIFNFTDTALAGDDGRNIVFVHSMEEALAVGNPLDVIVAWPSVYSGGMVEGINKYATAADLEAAGLSYPLTVEDLVDNWEAVSHLFQWSWGAGVALNSEIRQQIESHAQVNFAVQADENRVRSLSLLPGQLDAINELLEDQDLSEVDLVGFNERHEAELTVDDIPTWPITEADVYENPWLNNTIVIELLTSEELQSISIENLLQAERDAAGD